MRNIAQIKRKRSQRKIKKNAYKKALHHSISNNRDNSELIHNLSNFDLTKLHMDVLSKGLSFVPTPKPTPMNEIYSAFYKFCRRLYLKFHFLNKPTEELPPFHLPSVWEPPVPDNNNIQQYTSHIYREISHLQQPFLPVNNLSSKEFEAIHDLQSNRDIIIKPADKGGKIVIWGRKRVSERGISTT